MMLIKLFHHGFLCLVKRARRSVRILLLCVIVALANPAIPAQSISNATLGQQALLQQQQQRDAAHRQQQTRPPNVHLPRQQTPGNDRLPPQESPCFHIARITLIGTQAQKFQFALKPVISGDDPAINRCLGVKGINLVMKRVQNAIIKKGYVTTRIVVAPQDLTQDELALTVIPGLIHDIRFVSRQGARITKWDALPTHKGAILDLRDIEQGLENFKRVPTADADIEIVPATHEKAKSGESDLVVHYKQAFPLRLSVFADDSGSTQTGRYQGGVTLSYDNPFKLNDLFYVTLNHDLGGMNSSGQYGTNGYNVYYSVPFGYWLAEAYVSEYDYNETVAGINQSYSYSGTSRSVTSNLSYVIYRDATRRTTISLGPYLKDYHNFIEDTEVEVQRRREAGWQASISHREFIGSSTLNLTLSYLKGTGIFNALPAPEQSFGEGTARPSIFTGDVSLNIPFKLGEQKLRYSALWRGQWTPDPLTPPDRFSIGGRYTVRGFDGVNILSAECGWLLRNDLGFILGSTRQELYTGLDYGQVSGPSSDLLLGKQLTGSVVGLRGGFKGFSYDVFAGWPIDKPDGFHTAGTTVGFSVSWTY